RWYPGVVGWCLVGGATPGARHRPGAGESGGRRVPEDVGVLHRTRAAQVVAHRVALLLVGEHVQRDLTLERALLRPRLLTDVGELHRREPLTEDPLGLRRPVRTDHEEPVLLPVRQVRLTEHALPVRVRLDPTQVGAVQEFVQVLPAGLHRREGDAAGHTGDIRTDVGRIPRASMSSFSMSRANRYPSGVT